MFTTILMVASLLAGAAPGQQHTRAKASSTGAWTYRTYKNQMTDKVSTKAYLVSQNSVQLGFPYGPGVQGSLTVRMDTEDKLEVIFSVNKGQILCPDDTCVLTYRFDDGEVAQYGGSPSSDGSSNLIFLESYSEEFLGKLKGAKKLRVSVEFFQEGSQTFNFSLGSLDTDKIH